ncbi:glutathione S-transferase 1-like [Wyeomyia smithii]|uniref:glutathione S-transferase 1-like n=1 Tax=Wyeomyia smithii TaxID=174621 RepID=UPI002468227F|nr:glutathione S-transferase 1-like [Wyeomyia smithii]
MPIDLYCHIVAPVCRSVMLLAKALGIELNLIETDVLKGDQHKPEFLARNPQHCIPMLVDGDVVVWESNAILMYLAEKYGTVDKMYYPRDIAERSTVNRLLFFQIGTLHRALSTYYYPILTGTGEGKPEDFRKIQDAISVMDKFLEGNKWLAGEQLTVADFSNVVSVASLDGVIKFDLSAYKNVFRWYQQCKRELQGFQSLTMEAVARSQECIEAYCRFKRNELIRAQEEQCCEAASGSSCSKKDERPPCRD